jgi:hypothetical protein
MKRRPGHTANAFSRKSLVTTAGSLEEIEQNARSESVCRGEEAKFGGWDGGGRSGAKKRGYEGIKLAGVSVRRDLYPDGYGCNGRKGVQVGGQ